MEVFTKERKAMVEGVNIMTRHTKPNAKSPEGGRIEKPAPIFISKLMVVDKSGQPGRVGRKLNDKGELVRYSKRSQEIL